MQPKKKMEQAGNQNKLGHHTKCNDISDIITALEYLKKEAIKSGEEEIAEIIGATFTICLNTYYTLKRIEMEKMLK